MSGRQTALVRASAASALLTVGSLSFQAIAQIEPLPETPTAEASAAPAAAEAPAPTETKAPEGPPPAEAAPAAQASAAASAAPKPEAPAEAAKQTGFSFGSYGRMIAATDARGRPGRDADVVAHGSRLDEANYVELELRRDDAWEKTGATTRLVATLAFANPIFHYNGEFDAHMAVRNLYLEERGLLAKGLSVWAGSRMLRGDDIYLLDWWPLDNLNTVGAGSQYQFDNKTSVSIHMGLNAPDSALFQQSVLRPPAQNQFGATEVTLLDRQRFIGSLKASHIIPLGDTSGLKGVAYAELHELPEGQRETQIDQFETLPSDSGYVLGAQIGAFTGERDTHLNLVFRYARGLAAYGEFAVPGQLALDRTTSGASEVVVSLGGNYETGPFGVMLGAYLRSFRDASEGLNFEDVDEGIVALRPHVFFGESGGVALEGSYQVVQRGVLSLTEEEAAAGESPKGPLTAGLVRLGVVPFLSPAGRGDYSRPQFRLIYTVTLRSDAARTLYPKDDVFNLRSTEHFVGIGAEWWFNSSSYGG